jgi:hypothetical protein
MQCYSDRRSLSCFSQLGDFYFVFPLFIERNVGIVDSRHDDGLHLETTSKFMGVHLSS